jgi:hypothetical protein
MSILKCWGIENSNDESEEPKHGCPQKRQKPLRVLLILAPQQRIINCIERVIFYLTPTLKLS